MNDQKLLTIFSAPKPFIESHITIIQRNALRSWRALGEEVEILIMGSDEGIAENAKEIKIRHFNDVKCNQEGTPLIDSMLQIARQETSTPFLAIVNADIILLPDFIEAIKKTAEMKQRFLMVGQRWDIDINSELGDVEIESERLRERILKEGKLHPPMGSDYFIFPRSCYQDIPEFAIGRAGWDNWFIFKSRFEKWPVIDATHDVIIAHQNHDYRHLPGGQAHYRLPETYENVRLGGGEHTIFTLFDAQHQLINGQLIRKPWNGKKILRELEIFPLIALKSHSLGKLFFYLSRPRKAYSALRRFLKHIILSADRRGHT